MDPDPYHWLMDPDLRGPKTYGSGSATLASTKRKSIREGDTLKKTNYRYRKEWLKNTRKPWRGHWKDASDIIFDVLSVGEKSTRVADPAYVAPDNNFSDNKMDSVYGTGKNQRFWSDPHGSTMIYLSRIWVCIGNTDLDPDTMKISKTLYFTG
jgi:hypothetical protein